MKFLGCIFPGHHDPDDGPNCFEEMNEGYSEGPGLVCCSRDEEALLELARQTALPDDEEYTRNSRAAHLKRMLHEDNDGQQNRFVDLDEDVVTEDHGLVYNFHDGLLESAN